MLTGEKIPCTIRCQNSSNIRIFTQAMHCYGGYICWDPAAHMGFCSINITSMINTIPIPWCHYFTVNIYRVEIFYCADVELVPWKSTINLDINSFKKWHAGSIGIYKFPAIALMKYLPYWPPYLQKTSLSICSPCFSSNLLVQIQEELELKSSLLPQIESSVLLSEVTAWGQLKSLKSTRYLEKYHKNILDT